MPAGSAKKLRIEATFPLQRIGQVGRLPEAVALFWIKTIFDCHASFAQSGNHGLGLLG